MKIEFILAVTHWVGAMTRMYARRAVAFLLLKIGMPRVGLPDYPTEDHLSLIVKAATFKSRFDFQYYTSVAMLHQMSVMVENLQSIEERHRRDRAWLPSKWD
jgi:hypothetical protein